MIVVTGGAGFIGSALVWKLNSMGHKDILIVDENAANSPKWNNIATKQFKDYVDHKIFLENLEKGRYAKEIRSIFHMGACSSTTEMNLSYLREVNSLYSERLSSWCIKNHVYLAYASSAATYGNGEHGFSDVDTLTPLLRPLNPYGQSKLDFDRWVLAHGFEKEITGYRFFNVYGPNEYHKGSMRSMVQKGYEQIISEHRLKLFKSYRDEYANGGQLRDFVYVKDVVDVMIWFWENPSKKGIYNIGTGKAQSWNDLAHALFKACDITPNIEYVEMPPNIKDQYQYFTQADLKKLRDAGCPCAFLNLDHGVHDYVKNYLQAKNSIL